MKKIVPDVIELLIILGVGWLAWSRHFGFFATYLVALVAAMLFRWFNLCVLAEAAKAYTKSTAVPVAEAPPAESSAS